MGLLTSHIETPVLYSEPLDGKGSSSRFQGRLLDIGKDTRKTPFHWLFTTAPTPSNMMRGKR